MTRRTFNEEEDEQMRVSSPPRTAGSLTGSGAEVRPETRSSSIAPRIVVEASIRNTREFMTPFPWLIFFSISSSTDDVVSIIPPPSRRAMPEFALSFPRSLVEVGQICFKEKC